MNISDEYTITVLQTLLNHSIDFLIVGGYAVNYYGFRRTTGDIDVWLKPDNAIKPNLINAFRSLGIKEPILKEIERFDFTKMLVFSDGEAPFKIDFITEISGVGFNEAWNAKEYVLLNNLDIPFIHYNHLIASKISSSRLKDKLDVEELQKINNKKEQ